MYTVHLETSTPYDILIGPGLIAQSGALIGKVFSPCKAAVITDSNVHPLYARTVMSSLSDAGFQPMEYIFPAGEQSKTLATLSNILEFMAESQLTRSDIVVALGGGVTGDMAGFASAVYARGISFVQIPTTLLAAVDSSVGGKTAVDLKAGKNLAGAFHQPGLVITDTEVMAALSDQLLSEGAGEVIKYGVLRDPELFSWLCEKGWKEKLPEIILRCVEIKKDIVARDEFDHGERKLLNLGHTFGHSIERCSDFAVPHGFAVAIGMAIAAGAAGKKDIGSLIIQANRNCGLPCIYDCDPSLLAAAARTDKKRSGDAVDLIFPESIGSCFIKNTPVDKLVSFFEAGLNAIKEILE